MDVTKKISVNFSSLVGLKAELLRKQAEVQNIKTKTDSNNLSPQINKKRNKKIVTENIKKTGKELIDTDDIIAHKKSKLMLEAKTRLYERLRKLKNNDDKFLVDFKNKCDESDEFIDETVCEKYPIEPEENWVEYQDCFGRTRKCLREDLQYMQKKDDLIKQEVMKRNIDEIGKEESDGHYCATQQKEPEIEIMRRKWEEQTQKIANKLDIHYQDVLFDEARTHGVGYYAFSQDEEERAKQQENLSKIRKETQIKQKETKEIKELKEKMEQNRLKAARIRQRIRAGLPAESTDELTQENSSTNIVSNNNAEIEKVEFAGKDPGEIHEPIILKENNSVNEKEDEDKIRAFGELLDKKNYWHVMSQEEWIYKCREQRVDEFAPVYDNFTNTGSDNATQNINEHLIEENKKTFNIAENHFFQEAINLKDYKSNNDSNLLLKEDNNNQQNKNSPSNPINNDEEGNRLSINTTKSNDVIDLPNSVMFPKQTMISYPLSHLSKNYLENLSDYSRPQTSTLLNDAQVSFFNEDKVISVKSSNDSTHANKQETLSRNIDENNIVAGLKYLREKFEETHDK